MWAKQQNHIELLEVNFGNLIENPKEEIKKITAFLSISNTEIHKMLQKIDKTLYRNKKTANFTDT